MIYRYSPIAVVVYLTTGSKNYYWLASHVSSDKEGDSETESKLS